MRRFLYRFHVWVGIVFGAFIMMSGLTGSIMVMEEPIEALLQPELFRRADGSRPLASWQAMVDGARHRWPEAEVVGLTLGEPGDPARFELREGGAEGRKFLGLVDPETAVARGRIDLAWSRWLLQLHENLQVGDAGRAVMFFVGLGLVGLSLTGLWIHRDLWRNLVRQPRFNRGLRLGFSDVHKLIGVVGVTTSLVAGFTGTYIQFEAFERIMRGLPERPILNQLYIESPLSVEAAIAAAQSAVPDMIPTTVFFPSINRRTMRVLGKLPDRPLYGPFPCAVQVDYITGMVVNVTDDRNAPFGVRVRRVVGCLHYGNWAGLGLRLIYCITALMPAALGFTGFCIWYTRRASLRNPTRKIVPRPRPAPTVTAL
jgi:uncharacterized iron-regulated membrane protein